MEQHAREAFRETFDPDATTNAELIKGIVHYGRELMASELVLMKVELQSELQRARKTATLAGAAGSLAGVGAILLGFCAAHLLALTGLPFWACFALIGTLLVLCGAGLGFAALKSGKQIDAAPRELVADAERVFATIGQRAHDSLRRELDGSPQPALRPKTVFRPPSPSFDRGFAPQGMGIHRAQIVDRKDTIR